MSRSAGRAAFGGCLGVVLGGILGGVIGFLIADAYQPQNIFDTTRLVILLMGIAFGAISGAAIGAAVAVRLGPSRSQVIPDALIRPDHKDSRSPQESMETELARLKERMAELEERKRREEQG
jgi:hypothetical protein